MAEWTSDAQEYLEGYLRQVAALARSRRNEADEVVGELQKYIVKEAETAAGPLVTIDHLRGVLNAIGSPEQVAGVELPPPPLVTVQPKATSNGCVTIVGRIAVGYLIILCAIAGIGIILSVILPEVSRAREAERRAACQGNVKQVGLAFKMFSNESRGELYPELSPEAGRLMFANDSGGAEPLVYGEYLTDATILMCPSDVDSGLLEQELDEEGRQRLLDDHSYFYLGYAVTSDAEMAAFAEAYRARVAAGLRFDEDLDVDAGTGTAGGDVLYRLREGIGRVVASDPQSPGAVAVAESGIPVLIERIDNHVPAGGNVLFVDGHVEFIRYPGKWPMTRETVEILEALDAL